MFVQRLTVTNHNLTLFNHFFWEVIGLPYLFAYASEKLIYIFKINLMKWLYHKPNININLDNRRAYVLITVMTFY